MADQVAKQALHEAELDIFRCRTDEGVRAVRTWLFERTAEANRKWPGSTGEDLTRLQGEARLLTRLVEVIDRGPAIKVAQTRE